MKPEIKPRDRQLLVVAFSALVAVLMFRLAILPTMEVYETGKIEYEEKSAQAEEMQRLLDARSANEVRISEGNARLDELTGFCYEAMENRQVDALITGAALAHGLFPSHLSISEQTPGTLEAYSYSGGVVASAGTEATGVTPAGAEATGAAPTGAEATEGSAVRKAEASIALTGSKSNIRTFLNDIEENYSAIHVKSFEMSENLYMSTEQQPVTEIRMNVVLEVYMYHRPENP